MTATSAFPKRSSADYSMDLSKVENIDCPVCAAAGYQQKHALGRWRIVECNNCSFVYVNPRLQKSELLKIYSSNYFDNREFGYYHYTENKELRKKNFQKWISDALPFFKSHQPSKALDIGCAAGYCLEVFQQHSWQPYGIELDKVLASELRMKGFQIFDTPLVQLQTNERFDLISLFDVLEHLTDLDYNMRKMHSLLKEDGVLVLVTPDYGSWQRKLFRRKWFQFKPLEHINYFTLSTLQKLATNNGFQIISSKRSGQFCDTSFLENRLKKYNFRFLLPVFHFVLRLFNQKRKHFYVDTASVYAVLKKNGSADMNPKP